jgi:ribosomal protein S18 acetylase RimI-like enzyme
MSPEIRTTEPGLENKEAELAKQQLLEFVQRATRDHNLGKVINEYKDLVDKVDPKTRLSVSLSLYTDPTINRNVQRAVRQNLADHILTDTLPAYKQVLSNIDNLPLPAAVGLLEIADYIIEVNDGYLSGTQFRRRTHKTDPPHIQKYLNSSTPGEIDDIIKDIPDNTSSAFLKRIVAARLERSRKLDVSSSEAINQSEYEFKKEKELVESRCGTQEIEIDNSKQYVAKRDRVIIQPVSQGYYDVCFPSGDTLGSLLKREEGKTTYSSDDLIDINNVQMLGIRDGMSPQEKGHRYQARSDFQILSRNKEVLEGVEQDFEFPVRELSLREQIWFMASLREYSPEDEKQVIEFTKKFGLDGARAFLSCEYGDEFRDVVLGIGEKMDESVAKEVFAQYGEIAQTAQKTAKELRDQFYKEGQGQGLDMVEVEQGLLKRAKDFLAGIDSSADEAEVSKRLEQFNSDIVVFASTFRSLKGDKELSFEQIRGLSFESKTGPELEKEKDDMLDLFDQNWKDRDKVTAGQFRSALKEALDSDKSKFYTLKKDGKVAAFIRFDQLDDQSDSLHGGSFNVGPEFRGSGIGEAMLNQTVEYESENHIIFAEVPPEIEVGTHYVEAFNHVITGIVELPSEKGPREMLAIRLDKKTAPKFRVRQKGVSQKDLIQYAQEPGLAPEGVEVKSFDITKNKKAMLDAVRGSSYTDKVASRFFADPNNPNIRYLAFESDIKEVQALSERKAASGE